MDFREAEPTDAEAIRAVATAAWEADYPELISRETVDQGVEDWYDPAQLRREIDTGDATLVLGVDPSSDQVVAFSHAVVPDDGEPVGHLLRLYVHPDRRREGIGSDLLDATLDRLGDAGADRVRAMVLTANEHGKAFYREHGFDATDTAQTSIGGDPHEETTFERPIRASPDPP